MTFALTGASGQLGRLVADRLLQTADPDQVVLISRHAAALREFADRGATVRQADFDQPETLDTAFAGVDRLLLISGDQVGARRAGQLAAVDAAVRAGVSHVLYTSVPQPLPENPAAVVPDHLATELALRDSGLGWTALRNNLYAESQLAVIEQAATDGQLVTNAGDGRVGYVSRADCAAAAAGALLAGPGLAGPGLAGPGLAQTIDITGPEAVSVDDLAALAAERRGSPVEVVRVDDDAYIRGLTETGMPTFVAELLASFGTSTRGGFLAAVTPAVQRLGGQAPVSLRDLIRTAG